MTTCSAGSTWKTVTHTGAFVVVLGLSLGSSGVAFGADAAALTTVRAAIGADGAVRSVVSLGGNTTAPDKAALPVTMSITDQLDGKDLGADRAGQDAGQLTSTFHIENTSAKPMPVSYTDTDGTTKTANQDVSLPLVAELRVSLPASFTDVVADGARIAANADGSHELTWSMVLFAPLGSPTNVVSYSAKSSGKGSPVAQLETRAVVPNATPGLAATGQAANVVIAGNGTLTAFADGANDGLGKLSAGVGQLLDGLGKLSAGANKLHDGLGAGADGTNKLADGLHVALKGSGDLATGLGKLSAGNTKLADGTQQLSDGSGKLSAGLGKASAGSEKLVDGSQALATGAGLTADGASKLSGGLPQLVDGLKSLDAGLAKLGIALPAGLKAGQQQVKDAIAIFAVGAYIGSPNAAGTLLNGIAQLNGGLSHPAGALGATDPGGVKEVLTSVIDGLDAPTAGSKPGAKQALQGLQFVLGCGAVTCTNVTGVTAGFPGAPNGTPNGVVAQRTLAALVAGLGSRSTPGATALFALTGVISGVGTQSTPGTLLNGLAKVAGGLDHPSLKNADGTIALKADGVTPVDPGGLKQFLLEQIDGGIDKVTNGVSAALLDALGSPTTSPTTTLRGGVAALTAGAQAAAAGSVALADGTKKVAAGAGDLSELGAVPIAAGLAQLFAGSQALQTGLGSANSGAQQLAAGAKTASAGGLALKSGIGKISNGEDQVAAGLPAAVDGAGQLADGLGKVVDGETTVGKGLGDVKKQATSVLASQLKEGTANANRQLAGLEAVGNRVNEPGAASTTYVLTQQDGSTKLALAGNNSDSHVARNVGLGVGGLLLLLVGLAAGFVSGRGKTS